MRAPLLLCLLCASAALAAEPVVDGASAPDWQPCLGWVTKAPPRYSVSNEGGRLVFAAEGAGCEMPWLLDLDRLGFSGDQRYLLVEYCADGLSTAAGIYFLHGEEGSHGGRAYAMADELQPDGQWHTLAVDLLELDILEVTHRLAVKVFVGASGQARLQVRRLWFANERPAGALLARQPARRPLQKVILDWAAASPAPQTGWTTSPAEHYRALLDGTSIRYEVGGVSRGMRWLVPLPQPVDLAALPYLTLRYRAEGGVAGSTYAVWLGDRASGSGGHSLIALSAGDLKVDGTWHNVSVKLPKAFSATHLAVGLDSSAETAALTLDTVTFSSQPLRWTLAQTLPYEVTGKGWPSGQGGFTPLPLQLSRGSSSPFLPRRLGLSDWFSATDITVRGVPFAVPTDPAAVRQTATTSLEGLALRVRPDTRELYLLVAAVAPPTEPWGIDPLHPRPLELLDVPEKVCYEIRYASGPPDTVLPLDVAGAQWGLKRGLSLSVVHPDPARRPTELVVKDGMQTASFAIVAATARSTVLVREPVAPGASYAAPAPKTFARLRALPPAAADEPRVSAGLLGAAFTTDQGLQWAALDAGAAPGALKCAPGPVFEVTLGGTPLPPSSWRLEKLEAADGGKRFHLVNSTAGLRAVLACLPAPGHQLLLRMSLTNTGAAAAVATLRFPVLRGVTLGSGDTWYLCGRRGGIISNRSVSFHEPLGERHPLQLDGFFSPPAGLALACLTHDTVGQHHFINLQKTESGGVWEIEYPDRDLAPGQALEATEAALVLREGDWRAIFTTYRQWLASWFKPASPPKPWFERIFALASGNVHYDAVAEPRQRGNPQASVDQMLKYVGLCDYVHLYGWGASRQYGDWGDYDHYEELGGREYLRDNIARVQQSGRLVSLYLDGYLSSDKGRSAGAHAREWAMRRPDGTPQFVPEYASYNECPYLQPWRKYLSDTYARVQSELKPRVMYIDEIGATDGRWTCWARDHGHNAHEVPYPGEVALLQAIRTAVGPDVALYTEYPPAEASRRYLDGSITYQALWSADSEALAPHFIDLPRFAFPGFKQMHIIYYVPMRAGNWWLLKFPFFNGEAYRIGVPNLPGMDAPSLAFQKRAVEVQCAHREAFASRDVEPLVSTEVPGVYANRFAAADETVWTIYNANGRSVRTPVLRVAHTPGAVYEDAWMGQKLTPRLQAGQALLAVELGPKGVGCVVQRK